MRYRGSFYDDPLHFVLCGRSSRGCWVVTLCIIHLYAPQFDFWLSTGVLHELFDRFPGDVCRVEDHALYPTQGKFQPLPREQLSVGTIVVWVRWCTIIHVVVLGRRSLEGQDGDNEPLLSPLFRQVLLVRGCIYKHIPSDLHVLPRNTMLGGFPL